MAHFYKYISSNIDSVEKLKEYQGEYGFNIGTKRYHINYDVGLDVSEENTSGFTKKELETISNGILALINNYGKAKEFLYDKNSISGIDKQIEEYQKLLEKIETMKEADEDD